MMNEEDTLGASAQNRILFEELNLNPLVLEAVQKAGYENPSPIQERAIPPLLEGSDFIGVAQTGTGKTAAFSLPLLSRINQSVKAPQILVLAPTIELALQVSEAIEVFAEGLFITFLHCFAGCFPARFVLDDSILICAPDLMQSFKRSFSC